MMATVGPSTNTASASSAARTRLKLDSHLMPRPTPLTAETRNSAVVTAMMPSCEPCPTGSPVTACRPMPMPAANSIANQAPVENSGASSSVPSFSSPKRLKASASASTTRPSTTQR